MFNRLKNRLGRVVGALSLVIFLIGLAFASSYKQAQLSSIQEIQSSDNISNSLTRQHARTVRKSRNSAVNVMSMTDDGYISSSSGTYFTSHDKHYIITVSHGISDDCSSIRIMVEEEMFECIEIKIIDRLTDYAIIQVDEIPSRIAVRFPADYPMASEWRTRLAIQRNVYYTGFPNALGPLTFGGEVIGHDANENIYIHSFAWPGSSGSGVFSETGELIGIIIAISVGTTDFGVDVLEDIVIVIPLYKINWTVL